MTDRRRRLLLAGALVAAVVLLGLLAWALSRPGSPEVEGQVAATPGASPTEDAPEPARSPGPPSTAEPTATLGPTQEPVPLDEPAEFTGTGVSGRLALVERVEGEALGPGEVAGPAVRLTLELTNDGTTAISLDSVVVDLVHGPGASPGEPLSGPGAVLLEGTLEPGGTATGTYVFGIADAGATDVVVRVTYDPEEPSVQFEGRVPAA